MAAPRKHKGMSTKLGVVRNPDTQVPGSIRRACDADEAPAPRSAECRAEKRPCPRRTVRALPCEGTPHNTSTETDPASTWSSSAPGASKKDFAASAESPH